MGKVKCVKDFPCQQCGNKGMLQVISKTYARIRHYSHTDRETRKPRFIYHRNDIQYIEQQLKNIGQELGQDLHDLNLNNSGSNLKNALRGCPSLVGGRPAKPVVSNGRVGSNPTPRAKMVFCALN